MASTRARNQAWLCADRDGKKAPNSKLQTPNKLQAQNSNRQASASIARTYSRKRLLEEPEDRMIRLSSIRLGIWSLGFYWCLGFGIWGFSFASASEPIPLIHTHAHNDYEHKRPLFD